MGFLDKNDRIIDIQLTEQGRISYALGELEFVYFALSDDEIDYDPYIVGSGSLSPADLVARRHEIIDSSLVTEAPFVRLATAARGNTQPFAPKSKVFDSDDAQPLAQMQVMSSSNGITAAQRFKTAARGPRYERAAQTAVMFALSHLDDRLAQDDGFSVQILEINEDGSRTRLQEHQDTDGSVAFGPLVTTKVDR